MVDMMKKKNFYILMINLILSFAVFFMNGTENTWTDYINVLFYFTFGYLIVALFLYTKKGGFYDGVTFSFRRFISMMSKNTDYMEEWKERPLPSKKVNESFYSVVRFQAIALMLIFLLTFLMYMLNL